MHRQNKTAVIIACALLVLVLPIGAFSKIQLPVKLELSIEEPIVPGQNIKLVIEARSWIPLSKCVISITKFPPLVSSSQQIEIWNGDVGEDYSSTFNYQLPALGPGKYKIQANFEFLMEGHRKKPGRLSRNIFIDVRENEILSSNISFNHIKRLELMREIEKQGLRGASLEQIKSRLPEIAKKLEELNRIEAVETNIDPSVSIKKSDE